MRFLRAAVLLTATTALGALATPARAQVTGIDLSTMGIKAPTLDVGTTAVQAGTVQYSNSGGSSDAFSVGTSTSISASASASSTPDYSVNSKANFGVDASSINQIIGTSGSTNNTRSNSYGVDVERSAAASAEASVSKEYKREGDGYYWWRNNQWESTTEQDYTSARQSSYESAYNRAYENINSSLSDSGTISGSFAKSATSDASSNDVTVKGIGANNTVTAATGSAFNTDITKSATATGTSAGTASGSAAGNVGTTASANANSTQFVSSFVQAY